MYFALPILFYIIYKERENPTSQNTWYAERGKKQPTRHKRQKYGSGGIRTHASEETGALNQRLRPLGHATVLEEMENFMYL